MRLSHVTSDQRRRLKSHLTDAVPHTALCGDNKMKYEFALLTFQAANHFNIYVFKQIPHQILTKALKRFEIFESRKRTANWKRQDMEIG